MASPQLSRLAGALERVTIALGELGAQFALVGGLAVSSRTEPRFTRDVDLAIAAASDEEAEALLYALMQRGYTPIAVVEQKATGRLATARLVFTGETEDSVVVDLLFASSGIEADVVARATRLVVLPALSVPVATIGDLLALKALARDDRCRPQDAADLRALLVEATPTDLAEARAAAAEVTRRGFHRGRDVEGEVERAIRELGGTSVP